LARKSGKYGPIDKDRTPSYLCEKRLAGLSGGALHVARHMKPEKRHAEGAPERAGRIMDAEPKRISR
jgi:hypothetical protein